jgi:hypothetical protein
LLAALPILKAILCNKEPMIGVVSGIKVAIMAAKAIILGMIFNR